VYAGFVAVAAVLAADHEIRVDGQHGAEDFVLLFADGLRLERCRRFHGDERHYLHEVGDHHNATKLGNGRLSAHRLRRWFAYLVVAVAAFVVVQALLGPAGG
jgi:hypothetical protein